MGSNRARFALLAISFLAVLAASPTRAPAAPGDAGATQPAVAPAFIERALTELVLIETYVSDVQGRALTGLTADDFVLLVDGKKAPIASCEMREVAASGEVTGTATGGPAVPAASERPRRFMLFFEDGTSAPSGLVAARRAAHQFLATGLVPTDQVAIAAYDTGLRIVHDFTTDREALRRVIDQELHEIRRVSDFSAEQQRHDAEIAGLLERAKEISALRRGRNEPAKSLEARPMKSLEQSKELLPQAEALVKQAKDLAFMYGVQEAPPLKAVLKAMQTLVDSMAGWGGYKAIVFMGDGVPDNPATPWVEQINAVKPDTIWSTKFAQFSLSSELQSLVLAAAAAGVTIHTLETRGLEAGDARQMQAAERRSNSLAVMALNTGGLASSSNNFLNVLNDFEASSRVYYVLGYRPVGPPDGKFHSVQVRCRNRSARVRWRRGFTRLKPEQARERMILAAYTVPEMYPQMGLSLSAVAGPEAPSGRITDLVVHVPGDRILFLQEGGRATAHLEIGLVAADDSTKRTVQTSRKISVALRPEEGRPGEIGLNLIHRVRLPSGSQTITAVVYDDAGGIVGGARLPLPAAAPVAGRVLGLSIYSLRERSVWVDLPDEESKGTAPVPAEGRSVGPALKAQYAQGEPLVCGFRLPAGSESAHPDLRIEVLQGNVVLKTVGVESGDSGADEKVHVALPVEGLLPGDYIVTVQEVLPEGVVDRGTAPLSIRPIEAPPAVARPGTF